MGDSDDDFVRLNVLPMRPKAAAAWAALAVVGAVALYLPVDVLDGRQGLIGWDFLFLHQHRLALARDSLAAGDGVPGWNPAELLGAPFRANLQSFPWIPTRLPLLLLPPACAYAPGIAVAAGLSALFTFLFGRSIGLAPPAAALAGWTFAASGYFASRVLAGHLPLLEAFPTLPLLLWLVERGRAHATPRGQDVVAWAVAAACTALAGHPQLPVYALATAGAYVVFRGGFGAWARTTLAAFALGVGATAWAWGPMLSLLGRSTRTLALDPAANDLVLPWGRLLAAAVPDVDGLPAPVGGGVVPLFHGYPDDNSFWDTVLFTGSIPLVALGALGVASVVRRRWPTGPWLFLAVAGALALCGSLPIVEPLRALVPGTLLRSPARLGYVTVFAVALAMGLALQSLSQSPFVGRLRRLGPALIVAVALVHVVEVGAFARLFVRLRPTTSALPAGLAELMASGAATGTRVGVDRTLARLTVLGRDDAGIFDSVLLAAPYRALLAMSDAPARLNIQAIDAGERFSLRALQASGVGVVVTKARRSDLELVGSVENLFVYRVPQPAPRASFVAADDVDVRPATDLLTALAGPGPPAPLLLEGSDVEADVEAPDAGVARAVGEARYARPSTDRIVVEVEAGGSGYVKVVEAFDPGWSATVDGRPVRVRRADGYLLAVPVDAGAHRVVFTYATPGATGGAIGSAVALAGWAALVALVRRQRRAARAPQ